MPTWQQKIGSLLVCCLMAVAPFQHADAQVQRQPTSICGLAQGTDSRLCIIDGQIRNLEGQLRLARAAAGRGVLQPQNMAGSIRRLENQLRALKARRALIFAGATRGVTLNADDEDDDALPLFLLPLLALALMMGAGGGSSSTPGGGGPVTAGSDGIPSFQGDGITDIGGEPVSPS